MNTPIRWLSSLLDYYSWGSQCNSFAPKFENLAQEAKSKWRDDYEEELRAYLPEATDAIGPKTQTEQLKEKLKAQALKSELLKARMHKYMSQREPDSILLMRALKALKQCGSNVQIMGFSNTLKDIEERLEQV